MKAAAVEAAANMNGTTPKGSPANLKIDGFRIPKGTTHWRAFKYGAYEPGGFRPEERLGYGEERNGQQIIEWPIDTFGLEEIGRRWGAGFYRVHFVAYQPDGRPFTRGRTIDFRIGGPAAGEPVDAPAVPTSPAPPPRAGRFCDHCGGEQVAAARFCAHCGRPAAGAAAAPPVQASGGLADAVSFATAIQSAFQQGGNHTLALMGQISAQVMAEADARARRYEADAAARMQAEKLAHEREIARMNAQAGQGQLRAGDVKRVVAEVVKEELGEVHDRLDELEGDEEPAATTPPEAGSLTEKVNAAGMILDKAAPIVGDVAGRVIDALAKRGSGGASA